QVKAAFQNEHSAQAIAQIFGTLQTPAVAGLNTIDQTGTLLREITSVNVRQVQGFVVLQLLVTNTSVQNTVQGDRRFCVCDASEAGHQSSSEQSLFHV